MNHSEKLLRAAGLMVLEHRKQAAQGAAVPQQTLGEKIKAYWNSFKATAGNTGTPGAPVAPTAPVAAAKPSIIRAHFNDIEDAGKFTN